MRWLCGFHWNLNLPCEWAQNVEVVMGRRGFEGNCVAQQRGEDCTCAACVECAVQVHTHGVKCVVQQQSCKRAQLQQAGLVNIEQAATAGGVKHPSPQGAVLSVAHLWPEDSLDDLHSAAA